KNIATEANFTWVSGSDGTIPVDHSYDTNKGHYLQLTPDQIGEGEGKNAEMRLPLFKNLDPLDFCFQLYYILRGETEIVIHAKIGEGIDELGRIKGDVKEWELYQKTYNNFEPNQNVTFFIKGQGVFNGTIAIDDFSFATGSCPEAGSCSFENAHTCTWYSNPNDQLQWRVTDGRLSHEHGPERDHTLNTTFG
ncbi:unnamed protein product, partial [Meganyctiphanes norvegica]